MNTKKLLKYTNGNFSEIPEKLKDYEYAYGSTYGVDDIRKAVMDGQPTFVEYNKDTYLAVGENPESLILHDGTKTTEVTDSKFNKKFLGKAIIVTEEMETAEIECNIDKFVILTPERDSWPEELNQVKFKANSYLVNLRLGPCWLPPHPIILTYKKPTDNDIKDLHRSKIEGAEIEIYDYTNTMSEILHEIGHLYYNTSLNPDEREEFKEYWQEMKDKKRISAVFADRYGLKSDLECFCTIYMWYLKSKIIEPGYIKILEYHEPTGLKLLEGIINRIRLEKLELEEWETTEKAVKNIIDSNMMLKAKNKTYIVNNGAGKVFKLTDQIDYDIEGKKVEIKEGLLKGYIFEHDNGYIRIPDTLQKAEKVSKDFKLYVDMDGVLVDFDKRFKDIFKISPDKYIKKYSINDMFDKIEKVPNFWVDMEWTSYGKKLWNAIKGYNPIILSSPARGDKDKSKREKRAWLKREIGSNYKVILDSNKTKYADENSILIDDMEKNITPWENAGGIGILHSSKDTTLSALKNAIQGDKDLQRTKGRLITHEDLEKYAEKADEFLNNNNIKKSYSLKDLKEAAGRLKGTNKQVVLNEDKQEFLNYDNIKSKIKKVKIWKDKLTDSIKILREKINQNPTENQKKAGNYKKGKFTWNGFPITLENPKGSYRTGTGKNGNKWKSRLHYDYGYFNGTKGKDKDHIDVFVGNDIDSQRVYIVDQVDPATKKFDEHKIMIGFPDRNSAVNGYLKSYEKNWQGMGAITKLSVEKFRDWISNGNTKKPVKYKDSLLKALKDQVKIGKKIELEHTTDKKQAEKIAKDHLKEFDDYYTRLVEMEKQTEKDKDRPAIEKKIMKWFNENPNPTDKKVHGFAEKLKVDPDKLEQIIYKIATERAKMSRDVKGI